MNNETFSLFGSSNNLTLSSFLQPRRSPRHSDTVKGNRTPERPSSPRSGTLAIRNFRGRPESNTLFSSTTSRSSFANESSLTGSPTLSSNSSFTSNLSFDGDTDSSEVYFTTQCNDVRALLDELDHPENRPCPTDYGDNQHWEQVCLQGIPKGTIPKRYILREGWAYKAGDDLFGAYKPRFFILSNPFLYYFRGENETDLSIGCIYLRGATVTAKSYKDKPAIEFSQVIPRRPGESTSGSKFTIGFQDDKERQQWMWAVQESSYLDRQTLSNLFSSKQASSVVTNVDGSDFDAIESVLKPEVYARRDLDPEESLTRRLSGRLQYRKTRTLTNNTQISDKAGRLALPLTVPRSPRSDEEVILLASHSFYTTSAGTAETILIQEMESDNSDGLQEPVNPGDARHYRLSPSLIRSCDLPIQHIQTTTTVFLDSQCYPCILSYPFLYLFPSQDPFQGALHRWYLRGVTCIESISHLRPCISLKCAVFPSYGGPIQSSPTLAFGDEDERSWFIHSLQRATRADVLALLEACRHPLQRLAPIPMLPPLEQRAAPRPRGSTRTNLAVVKILEDSFTSDPGANGSNGSLSSPSTPNIANANRKRSSDVVTPSDGTQVTNTSQITIQTQSSQNFSSRHFARRQSLPSMSSPMLTPRVAHQPISPLSINAPHVDYLNGSSGSINQYTSDMAKYYPNISRISSSVVALVNALVDQEIRSRESLIHSFDSTWRSWALLYDILNREAGIYRKQMKSLEDWERGSRVDLEESEAQSRHHLVHQLFLSYKKPTHSPITRVTTCQHHQPTPPNHYHQPIPPSPPPPVQASFPRLSALAAEVKQIKQQVSTTPVCPRHNAWMASSSSCNSSLSNLYSPHSTPRNHLSPSPSIDISLNHFHHTSAPSRYDVPPTPSNTSTTLTYDLRSKLQEKYNYSVSSPRTTASPRYLHNSSQMSTSASSFTTSSSVGSSYISSSDSEDSTDYQPSNSKYSVGANSSRSQYGSSKIPTSSTSTSVVKWPSANQTYSGRDQSLNNHDRRAPTYTHNRSWTPKRDEKPTSWPPPRPQQIPSNYRNHESHPTRKYSKRHSSSSSSSDSDSYSRLLISGRHRSLPNN